VPIDDEHPPLPRWAARWVPDLTDDVARRAFGGAIAAILVVGLVAFLAVGANSPPDPMLDRSTAAATIPGYDQIGFRLRPSPSHPELDALVETVRCALLAGTPEERARGLRELTDLQGYVGMIFRFDEDVTAAFTMEGVTAPLAVAWFDAGGLFVSQTDMEPCPAGGDCPAYVAEAPFRYALETPPGGLAALGAGPGSRLLPGGLCPAQPVAG